MTAPPMDPDRLRGFVRTAPDAILIAAPETGEIVEANEAAEALFGYPRTDLVGMHQSDLHPSDQLERYRQLFRDHLESGQSVISQFTDGSPVFIETAAGDHVPVEINAWTIQTDDDVLFQGVFRDISDRLQRERRLDQYREAIRSTHDPIAAIDDAFSYLFANAAYCEPTDFDETEIVGRSVSTVIGEDTFESIRPLLERTLAGESIQYESAREYPTGETREYVVRYSPLTDDLGDVYGVVGSMHDVTTRNEIQRTLEQRNEQLLVLNRIVRHDIRNDMNVLLGWSHELESHVDNAGRTVLDRMVTTGQHVVDLTATVRDFIETLGPEDQPPLAPIDLHDVIDKELAERRATHAGAVFTVGREVPHVLVEANELLSSVFRNVLNNAVQHNDREEPHVEVSVAEGETTVTVRIADDGPGIPDEMKEVVFGRGEGGMEAPGSGIGLYLVDTLLAQYGGDVWVEDNEPTGAVFVIELQKAD